MSDCGPDIVCALNKFDKVVRAPCVAHKLDHCAKDLLIVRNIKINTNKHNITSYRMKSWNYDSDKLLLTELTHEEYELQLSKNLHKLYVSDIVGIKNTIRNNIQSTFSIKCILYVFKLYVEN